MDALQDALRQADAEAESSEFDLQDEFVAPGPDEQTEMQVSAGAEGTPQPAPGENAGNDQTTGQDLSELDEMESSGGGEQGPGEGGQQPGEAPGREHRQPKHRQQRTCADGIWLFAVD